MAQSSNVMFREGDKLKGLSNYYIWALKMRVVLKAKGQWVVMAKKKSHATFLVTIDRDALTETT